MFLFSLGAMHSYSVLYCTLDPPINSGRSDGAIFEKEWLVVAMLISSKMYVPVRSKLTLHNIHFKNPTFEGE